VNKSELVDEMSDVAGLTKTDCSKALNAFIAVVTKALKKKKKVSLVGFGTFLITHRSASEGRNPRTGAPIKIKASNQPKFRAGKSLKESVN
jgi:DNA-binding protein HU-beta